MIRVTLPFPAPGLFPNRSKGNHWTGTHAARTHAATEAYALAWQALKDHPKAEPWPDLTRGAVRLSLTFYPPDKRHRDLDNCLAAMKPALDGLATALVVDDRIFDPITVRRGVPTKGGGFVQVEVGEE